MGIDFSKAPKGYPIWIQAINGGGSGWHRDDGTRYTDEDGTYWTKPADGYYEVHKRPTWSGDGMPPAGTELEFLLLTDGDSRWIEGEILYISHYTAVISGNGFEHVHHPHNLKFRPVRTPGQIEHEAKMTAIYDM